MASLTLKNIPDPLLERLRQRAEADRRSLTQEILHLLEGSLDRPWPPGDPEADARARARAQADALDALGGGWRSDLEAEEEIEQILAARTRGRDIDL